MLSARVILPSLGGFVISDQVWTLLVLAELVLLWLTGGTSKPVFAVGLVVSVSALVVLAAALLRLHSRPLPRPAWQALGLMILVALLPLVQLVPLPPSVWTALAGRGQLISPLADAGVPAGWHGLSLDPAATKNAFIALLPGLALFLAGLGVVPRQRAPLVWGLVGLAASGTMLGLAQRFLGPDSLLNFYAQNTTVFPAGTFNNRNFLAAQIASALPLGFAGVIAALRKRRFPAVVVIGFGVVLLIIMIVGLGVTGSRAGILLAMVAVLLSVLLSVGHASRADASPSFRAVVAGGALAVLLVAQFGLVGILRLANTDLIHDYRNVITAVSWETLKSYFPWGSGFGTFVPVYALHESPATMVENYVNHAHNDWLEAVLEGGVLAAAAMATFVLWFVPATVRVWRQGGGDLVDLTPRAASISALVLMTHSFVDYPLRMPFLMAVFGLLLSMVAMGPGQQSHHHQSQRKSALEPDPDFVAARPLRPRQGPYFKTAVPPMTSGSSPPAATEPGKAPEV